MLSVDERGEVDDDEHIFDVLTKDYDFIDTDVKVLSAQDLLKFYNNNQDTKLLTQHVDIYNLVQFFMKNNPDGHFIIDECPVLKQKGKGIKLR